MLDTTKIFLGDRDHLNHLFSGRRGKELLQKHGYTTVETLFQTLVDQKSHGADYVVGLAGTGKTTFAKKQLGAQVIETNDDILSLLTLRFDKMVFVTCDIEDKIAQNAESITLLHTSSERLGQQRDYRDVKIKDGNSETSFGRKPGTVKKVTTDDSIIISRLKTDYEDKSRIVAYNSNDPTDRDTKKNIAVRALSDKRKYTQEGVVIVAGKWSPMQIAHQYQLSTALSLSHDKNISLLMIIGESSGKDYDLGLTQHERMKIINLEYDADLQFITSGTPKFIKNSVGKVINIVPEKSRMILGKDRLPAGFTEGSYADLVEAYPDFFANKKSSVVKKLVGSNFLNVGNLTLEGSEESINATFVRKCLVQGNIPAIQSCLSPKVFTFLTHPHNLQVLQRRYALIQERDQKLKEKKEELMWKHKQIHPLTHQPLMNKKGEAVFLTKTHANACKTRRDYVKIMTYLQDTDKLLNNAEKKIRKHYSALIYSSENTLRFT